MSRLTRRDALVGSLAALGGATACRRAARDGGRTIASLWFAYGGTNRQVLLELVDRFNQSQSKVLVEATFQGDYFESLAKLRTAMAVGAGPSMSHVVGEVLPYLAEAGVLEPLDAYDGARDIPFVRALSQAGAYVGGDARPLVGIPFNRSTPIMYCNRAMLDDASLAPPRTWDELRGAARALTVPPAKGSSGSRRFGYEVPIDWWFWVAMVGQAGGRVVDDDGTASLGGAAGERALRFWQTLMYEDRVMRAPAGRDYNSWQATNQDFLAGRAAMTWTSTAFLRYLEDNARFPVVAAKLPRDVRAAVPTGGTLFVVLRASPAEEKQAAWAFLRFMCEPDQVVEWATRTGYLPITETAVQRLEATGYYAKHPNDRVAYDQLADAMPWPWAPNLFRVQRDAVQPALEEAVLTNSDPHAAMETAREDARRAG